MVDSSTEPKHIAPDGQLKAYVENVDRSQSSEPSVIAGSGKAPRLNLRSWSVRSPRPRMETHSAWVTGPDESIDPLLQSTRGAWTDAPGRRARAGNWIGCTSLRFPVDKPRNWVIGVETVTHATLSTVRKDRKIKDFPLTR